MVLEFLSQSRQGRWRAPPPRWAIVLGLLILAKEHLGPNSCRAWFDEGLIPLLNIIVRIGQFLRILLFFAIIFFQVGFLLFFGDWDIISKFKHSRIIYGHRGALDFFGHWHLLNGRSGVKLVEKVVAVKIYVQLFGTQILGLALTFAQEKVAKVVIFNLGNFFEATCLLNKFRGRHVFDYR